MKWESWDRSHKTLYFNCNGKILNIFMQRAGTVRTLLRWNCIWKKWQVAGTAGNGNDNSVAEERGIGLDDGCQPHWVRLTGTPQCREGNMRGPCVSMKTIVPFRQEAEVHSPFPVPAGWSWPKPSLRWRLRYFLPKMACHCLFHFVSITANPGPLY